MKELLLQAMATNRKSMRSNTLRHRERRMYRHTHCAVFTQSGQEKNPILSLLVKRIFGSYGRRETRLLRERENFMKYDMRCGV